MSTKWLEREGPRWVREDIITREQYERIASLYGEDRRAIGLLPIFGSILIGLGILSFIAANWDVFPALLRLGLILVVMLGFYRYGSRWYDRGSVHLGNALLGLGLFAFGGGIILIGQMFHMLAFSAMSIVIWGTAGLLLTFLYQSRYLFGLSFAIITGAQLYSVSSYHTFSYAAAAVAIVGLGIYAARRKDVWVTWLFSLGFLLQWLMLMVEREWPFGWFFVPVVLLYAAGDWLQGSQQNRGALQSAMLAAGFLFGSIVVMFQSDSNSDWVYDLRGEPWLLLPALGIVLGLSLYGKLRGGRLDTWPELVVFLPLYYLPPAGVGVLYLVSIFLFSLFVLMRGYTVGSRTMVNIGTLLFIVSTMIAYGKLTWDFMDKSLFFMVGGGLLLGLSWFLNRRRVSYFADSDSGQEGGDRL